VVVEKRITIRSEWEGWETSRLVLDKKEDLLEPIETEDRTLNRTFTCWYCKGAGHLTNPFVEAGRIEAKPCHRCNGSGKVKLNSAERVDAVFDAEKIGVVRKYERKGDLLEVVEVSFFM